MRQRIQRWLPYIRLSVPRVVVTCNRTPSGIKHYVINSVLAETTAVAVVLVQYQRNNRIRRRFYVLHWSSETAIGGEFTSARSHSRLFQTLCSNLVVALHQLTVQVELTSNTSRPDAWDSQSATLPSQA